MKVNLYILIFGILVALIVLAWLSTFVFNQSQPSASNLTLTLLPNYGPAPQIQGIANWINSPPLSLSALRGKVVLIDFWTYSCINCIRTIPYLNALESKYGNDGLVIIGVETPEFQFETNFSNVENAVQTFGIKYPVAEDNNYDTWTAYNNHYWPADYLIDKNGDVRYVSFGEGDYNVTEAAIRLLLQNAGYNVTANLTLPTSAVNFSQISTAETYLGYATARTPIGNAQGFSPGNVVDYALPDSLQNNTAYFSGEWFNAPDSMISVNGSELFMTYKAKSLNVVAGGNSTITIKLDGKNLTQAYAGEDVRVSNGAATSIINSSRLYNLIDAPSYGWHTIEIDAKPGFRAYTFTFG